MNTGHLVMTAAVPVEIGGEERPVEVPDFKGQYQSKRNWCWAAAAASVHSCYEATVAANGNGPAAILKQCAVAARHLNLQSAAIACGAAEWPGNCDCLDQVGPRNGCNGNAYDSQEKLNSVLEKLELLEVSIELRSGETHAVHDPRLENGVRVLNDRMDLEEIRALIDAGRLVCLRTVDNGIKHFIVLYGYDPAPDTDVHCWDPAIGHRLIDYDNPSQWKVAFTHKIVTRPRQGAQ